MYVYFLSTDSPNHQILSLLSLSINYNYNYFINSKLESTTLTLYPDEDDFKQD